MWAGALPHLQSVKLYCLTMTDVGVRVPAFARIYTTTRGMFMNSVPTQSLKTAVKKKINKNKTFLIGNVHQSVACLK